MGQFKNEKDIKLSQRLKKKYKHKLGNCYNNTYDLYKKGLIDTIVIGYTTHNNSKFYVRHAWGLKDGNLIDTTFEDIEKVSYEPLFFIDKDNFCKAMLRTSGNSFDEYDLETEYSYVKRLDNAMHIIIHQNPELYKLAMSKGEIAIRKV